MAKLSKESRSKLPNSEFAGPGRSYPVNDKVHAEKALQLVGRGVKAGNISQSTADHIKSKARDKLGMAKGGSIRNPAANEASTYFRGWDDSGGDGMGC